METTKVTKSSPIRRKGIQPIKALLEDCLEPSLKAKGFASAQIHMHWAEIVGAALAPWSEPVSLKWPPRAPGADQTDVKSGAVLTIKVEGAFALDLQHQAQQVIERVNSFFGWRCIEKIILKQGPLAKRIIPEPRQKRELTAEASRKLDTLLQSIDNPDLKASLARLGVGVMGRIR
ncbi:MAG: DUF721 domain-containing protein [Beijerinckiaceae bacterium]